MEKLVCTCYLKIEKVLRGTQLAFTLQLPSANFFLSLPQIMMNATRPSTTVRKTLTVVTQKVHMSVIVWPDTQGMEHTARMSMNVLVHHVFTIAMETLPVQIPRGHFIVNVRSGILAQGMNARTSMNVCWGYTIAKEVLSVLTTMDHFVACVRLGMSTMKVEEIVRISMNVLTAVTVVAKKHTAKIPMDHFCVNATMVMRNLILKIPMAVQT